MAEKKTASKFLETKYFGLVIGVLVFLLLFALSSGTVLVQEPRAEAARPQLPVQEHHHRHPRPGGCLRRPENPRISPDILIVGIDDKALDRFGRWPFPRYRHADLINAFSRIKNQGDRERALFIDVFFSEPSEVPEDDALLVSSIKSKRPGVPGNGALPGRERSADGGRVLRAVRTSLTPTSGRITNIKGDWLKVNTVLRPGSPAAEALRRAPPTGTDTRISSATTTRSTAGSRSWRGSPSWRRRFPWTS